MMIRTALNDKARAELVAFCAANLKSGMDAARYADALESETNLEGNAVFEISFMDSRTSAPATISFSDDADFWMEDVE